MYSPALPTALSYINQAQVRGLLNTGEEQPAEGKNTLVYSMYHRFVRKTLRLRLRCLYYYTVPLRRSRRKLQQIRV